MKRILPELFLEPRSLDELVHDDGSMTFGDTKIAKTPRPDEIAIKAQRDAVLHECLNKIDPRTKRVLLSYFETEGLGTRDGCQGGRVTYEDIGREFNLSRERIRQLIKEGLAHLRLLLGRRGWVDSQTGGIPDVQLEPRRQEARRMRYSGRSYENIANALRVSRPRVIEWCIGIDIGRET